MIFLLPKEYIDTLKRLQDRCAPSTLDEAKEIFLEESGCSLEEYFSEFDVDPIGVATLAQVHLARLKTGERVAVKIQHKKLDAYVESDIKMAEKAIRLSEKLQPGLDLGWLVGGIKNSINEERDFVIEAKNMEDIRKISEINPVCVVPKVYYKSRRVLVMEYIDGARIDDRAYAKKNNINPRELSYELHKVRVTLAA